MNSHQHYGLIEPPTKSTTDHTPFTLAYGSEAVIPVELKVSSHRVTYYDPRMNIDFLLESLDFVDEKCE